LLDLDLFNSEILGKTFISNVIYLDEIDSTNVYTKNPDIGDNVLVIAEFQSSGKGRLNRIWESNKGENLTFTIKKNFDVDAQNIQCINFFFSYFLLRAIEEYSYSNMGSKNPPEFELKWPNDILFDNKKVSGLLIENNNRNFLIGIGLNVNQRRFSSIFDSKSASLAEITGKTINRTELLIKIIQVFNDNINLLLTRRFKDIYTLWVSRCKVIGKTVEFTYTNNFKDTGYVVDVLRDGGIVLRIDNSNKTFYSGDIMIKNR